MELGATVRAVKSRRVLLGDVIQPAVIYVRDGKIQSVRPGSALSEDEDSCEAGVALGDRGDCQPSVDSHVLATSPERTSWEGFWTATVGTPPPGGEVHHHTWTCQLYVYFLEQNQLTKTNNHPNKIDKNQTPHDQR
ncbi:unnamed protein product [Boreogadus saida]